MASIVCCRLALKSRLNGSFIVGLQTRCVRRGAASLARHLCTSNSSSATIPTPFLSSACTSVGVLTHNLDRQKPVTTKPGDSDIRLGLENKVKDTIRVRDYALVIGI